MKGITTCLWFNGQGKEAAEFYTSVFKNSKIVRTTYYPKEAEEVSGMKEGDVLTIDFTINGQEFMALNGGPHFKFNEAISIVVNCDSQEEIDDLYKKLSAVPESEICGWLKDKFGLSWQIVPAQMQDLWENGTKEQTGRMMAAMLKMKKLNIAELEAAYYGKARAA